MPADKTTTGRPALPRRPEWVGTDYVARMMGVHPQTVRRWRELGLIEMPKVMGRRVMTREALHALIRDGAPT